MNINETNNALTLIEHYEKLINRDIQNIKSDKVKKRLSKYLSRIRNTSEWQRAMCYLYLKDKCDNLVKNQNHILNFELIENSIFNIKHLARNLYQVYCKVY